MLLLLKDENVLNIKNREYGGSRNEVLSVSKWCLAGKICAGRIFGENIGSLFEA